MEDRSRVALSMLVGAAVGGAVGYLLFTESGRRLRAQVRPQLEGLLDDASQLQGTVRRIRDAAGEGWRSMTGLFADLADEPSWAGDDDDGGRAVS